VGGLAAGAVPDYIWLMPISQKARSSVGESITRNNYGVAPRTLGGLFAAPTTYTSFGSNGADFPFPDNTQRTLGSVNLPAYTLNHGAVVRMSFAGTLTWNAVAGGFAFLRLQVTPNSAGVPYNIALATGAPTDAGATYWFGGQITLLAQQEPSPASNVAISTLTSDIQKGTAPVAPYFQTPQGTGAGLLLLDTAGLSSGIDFNLQVSLSGGASIGFTQLRYFLTEIVGG
jgi:hypothetical protein